MGTHSTEQRRTWRDRLFGGRRKYAFVFVTLLAVGAAALATAAWIGVEGHGLGYGKAKQATVFTVTTVDLTDGSGVSAAIGPSETGNLDVRVFNGNGPAVTLTSAAVPAGSSITDTTDAGCTAAPSTFTVTDWTGSQGIGGFGTTSVQLPITTGPDFPACLAGHIWSIPVDLS